ncbi:hypothetical protein SAMN05444273_10731 [Litoreibacter ascidiaceicola]|uniref:Uncharacterized protein n=1 Tax=Litoreibacter ascidiaceicola TaxID=1486859 RepID=A0A1M5CAM9_9RHOB|nr:hypothetical protein [Litoreibacter ascidiaceicola]SHF51813.1 hypothetical protein SAMN05444273_10731 [Litoreibacter ascidiaceicola]
MDNPLEISKHETGLLRVFQITDDVALPYSLKGDSENLERALGGTRLDPQEMQSLNAGELSEDELRRLLVEGYDIAPEAVNMSKIPHTTSALMLIRSAAFEKKPVLLKLTENAKLVATFTEGRAPAPKFTPLDSDAAKGVLEGPAADAKQGRGFGARLAVIAMAAMVSAAAIMYFYYTGL